MIDGLINTGYTIVKDILSYPAKMKDLKLSADTLLRSYYFELCTNLDILDVIDSKKLKGLPVNSRAVFSMLAALEIQVASAIVFSDGDAEKKIYSLLSKSGKVEELSETDGTSKEMKKSVLEAMHFTLCKISALQKLSAFESEKDKDILKNIRLGVRIENIRTHLLYIRKQIDTNCPIGSFPPKKPKK